MTEAAREDTPLTEAQRDALGAFEAWSDAAEEALVAGDPDELVERIAGREAAILELEDALAGRSLPHALRPRFAEREARVSDGLRRLSDSILAQLAEARQHAKARARYARAEATGASADEEAT
jgi:hypothetical protein